MEASVNAFHPPRAALFPPSLPPFHLGYFPSPRRAAIILHVPSTQRQGARRFRKGSEIDPMENLTEGRGEERKRDREREGGGSRRRRVYRGAQPVANSQRDYRRRITAIPRPNTNWSLGSTAARSGSNGGEWRRFRACMERRCIEGSGVRVRARKLQAPRSPRCSSSS